MWHVHNKYRVFQAKRIAKFGIYKEHQENQISRVEQEKGTRSDS